MEIYSIYVGQLPRDITKEDLIDLFSDCGTVKNIYLSSPEACVPYCYAFVQFSDAKCVLKATQEIGHWAYRGRTLRVEISHATKDLLRLTTRPRYPSLQRVNRSNSDRSRLKEACCTLNKTLDLIHGDQPLDMVWLLSQMEMRHACFAPRVKGNVCPGACTTEAALFDSIGAHSAKEPAAIEQRKEELRCSIASIQAELDSHHATATSVAEQRREDLRRKADQQSNSKDHDSIIKREEVAPSVQRAEKLKGNKGSGTCLNESTISTVENLEQPDFAAKGLEMVSEGKSTESDLDVRQKLEIPMHGKSSECLCSTHPRSQDIAAADKVNSSQQSNQTSQRNISNGPSSFPSRTWSCDQQDVSSQLQQTNSTEMPVDPIASMTDVQKTMENFCKTFSQWTNALNRFLQAHSAPDCPKQMSGNRTSGLHDAHSRGLGYSAGPVNLLQVVLEAVSAMNIGSDNAQHQREQLDLSRVIDFINSYGIQRDMSQGRRTDHCHQSVILRGTDQLTGSPLPDVVTLPPDSVHKLPGNNAGGISLPRNGPVLLNPVDLQRSEDLRCACGDCILNKPSPEPGCGSGLNPQNSPAVGHAVLPSPMSSTESSPYSNSQPVETHPPLPWDKRIGLSSSNGKDLSAEAVLHCGSRICARSNDPVDLTGSSVYPEAQCLNTAHLTQPQANYQNCNSPHTPEPVLACVDRQTDRHTLCTTRNFNHEKGPVADVSCECRPLSFESPFPRPFVNRPEHLMKSVSTDKNNAEKSDLRTSTPSSGCSLSELGEGLPCGKEDLGISNCSDGDEVHSSEDKEMPRQDMLESVPYIDSDDQVNDSAESEEHAWYQYGKAFSKLQVRRSLEKSSDSGISVDGPGKTYEDAGSQDDCSSPDVAKACVCSSNADLWKKNLNTSETGKTSQKARSECIRPLCVQEVKTNSVRGSGTRPGSMLQDCKTDETRNAATASEFQGKMIPGGRGRGIILSLLRASLPAKPGQVKK